MELECTVVLTAAKSDVSFQWKHDHIDVDSAYIETRTREKDELLTKIQEKLIERRRKANRSPAQSNISAPKVPLASSSVSKLKNVEEDDDETDDIEFNNSDDDDDFIDEDDKNFLEEQIKIVSNLPINSTIVTSILNLKMIDRKHMGRYQCIASNKFGSTYSKRFRVSVACELKICSSVEFHQLNSFSLLSALPIFTKTPSNITVYSTKTVRLECAVDGDPKPTVYWQFNSGNDFPAARERRMHVMPDDEVFFITNSKVSDQGVYTCTATNSAGIIRANATITICKCKVTQSFEESFLLILSFSGNSVNNQTDGEQGRDHRRIECNRMHAIWIANTKNSLVQRW